ncbi:MAG TPA: 2-phospho-L-lactate transferase [Chloroflexia bacterium]|nr:2-phospho-L-lactate transferase [Chloroflexia bacterium]
MSLSVEQIIRPEEGGKIVTLAGGVGGAKLASGLYRHLKSQKRANQLAVVVNTGDDMDYLGLHISPDLDTVMYTLAGIANPNTGWGIAGDTANALQMLGDYGHDNWFWLGDRDIGTHLKRTDLLRQGLTLTRVTSELSKALGIECQILPMTDQPVRTIVQTAEAGELAFQEYFVRRRAADTVTGLSFQGIEEATVPDEICQAFCDPSLIIICPSNPYLSIAPILAVPGMREVIRTCTCPIVVVSPIVGGEALKGPAAAIMRSLGGEEEASALAVAKIYAGFAQRFVLDEVDAAQQAEIEELAYKTLVTNTIMKTDEDKIRLAAQILESFIPNK